MADLYPWRREPPRRRVWDLLKLVLIFSAILVLGAWAIMTGTR